MNNIRFMNWKVGGSDLKFINFKKEYSTLVYVGTDYIFI